MSIALLTAGASLARDWNESKFEEYDLVYAVNRAAVMFRHHYNCFCDEEMSALYEKDGTKTFTGSISTNVWDQDFSLYGKHPRWLSTKSIQEPETTRCRYTFPCALREVSLQSFCGDLVDIYGLDCGGTGVGNGTIEYPSLRWRLELPWVAYAMPKNIRNIYGDIREDWKQWILKPEGKLPV
tara:strand:+ start:789 stop:1334 length:546 start_codon:yes stop_codon:yes gene_type:complete